MTTTFVTGASGTTRGEFATESLGARFITIGVSDRDSADTAAIAGVVPWWPTW